MSLEASRTSEVRPLVRIAVPVVIGEIGWMSMGLVDTVMVGPLGPAAIAATGLGSSVFMAIAVFGMGLLLGLDTLVSQAFGARQPVECRRLLHQGLWLALLVSPFVFSGAALATLTIDRWNLNPSIRDLAGPYLHVINLSTLPLLLYAALRRYLLGIHHPRPIMLTLLSANLVNIAANYVLIYGHFGFPALGVRGSAVATTLARCYMVAMLWMAVRIVEHGTLAEHVSRAVDLGRLVKLVRLGFPAACQVTLEVGAFIMGTVLAARLDAVSSASHQIAINIASLAYMVPLGLSSAAAVRVGHAVGAGDLRRATRAGWTAICLSSALMMVVGVLMWAVPEQLLRPFTADARVIAIGSTLLLVAAAFQIFDAVQTVAIGSLRGLGDTTAPMVFGLVGHWLVGLPIGYLLCFRFDWGVTGLWIGFLVGLIVVAFVLLAVWARRTQQFTGHLVSTFV